LHHLGIHLPRRAETNVPDQTEVAPELAEANVPYDELQDMDEINSELANANVALVMGANDVVNSAAKNDKSSPIYGMRILKVDQAKASLGKLVTEMKNA
jgi:NAD/NADP transhydrogenase beta subunit